MSRGISIIFGVFFIVLVAGESGILRADLLLNGSFESNTATATTYNLSNNQFNSLVSNATAFGNSITFFGPGEIDLVTFGNQFSNPVDSNWALMLHAQIQGGSDAFAFHLASGLTAGQDYRLSFHATARTHNPVTSTEPLEFGISTVANSFGTLALHSGQLPLDQWTSMAFNFTAPVSGNFFSVRVANAGDGIHDTAALIDGFQLTAIPEPSSLPVVASLALPVLRRPRRL